MRISTSILAALFLLTGCVDGEPDDDGAEPGEAVRLDARPTTFGAFDRGKAWPRDTLTVCWHASALGGEFIGRRQLIQNTLNREWGKLGRIRFTWIFSCDQMPNADIRIGHDPAETGFSQIGIDALTVPAGDPTMIIDLLGPPPGGCLQLPPTNPGDPPTGPIARCDGIDNHGALPPNIDVWVAATALHEMGHALGLRHEHARPDSTCIVSPETLDVTGHDGEAIWPFDAGSIMSYCHLGAVSYAPVDHPRLGAGDIRALHTLYPGTVGLFPDSELAGTTLWIGPGYFTRTTTPALAQLSSLVVPPGFRVVACTSSQCAAFTGSARLLPAGFNDAVQNVLVTATATVHRDPGYLGVNQALPGGLYRTSQLATVGDNQISSVWVPPTTDATLCTDDNLTGGCIYLAGGTFGTSGYAMSGGIDNQTSSVQVTSRVVTFSDRNFRGESWSLGLGTYRASAGAAFLPAVRALAVPGLRVTACTAEGTCTPWFGCGGAGTCVTTESSIDLSNMPAIKFLKIATVPVVFG